MALVVCSIDNLLLEHYFQIPRTRHHWKSQVRSSLSKFSCLVSSECDNNVEAFKDRRYIHCDLSIQTSYDRICLDSKSQKGVLVSEFGLELSIFGYWDALVSEQGWGRGNYFGWWITLCYDNHRYNKPTLILNKIMMNITKHY
jgi:hypothetical protein